MFFTNAYCTVTYNIGTCKDMISLFYSNIAISEINLIYFKFFRRTLQVPAEQAEP